MQITMAAVGINMANQLELNSFYSCCGTRKTKGSMEMTVKEENEEGERDNE